MVLRTTAALSFLIFYRQLHSPRHCRMLADCSERISSGLKVPNLNLSGNL